MLLQPLKQIPWSYRDNLVIYILQSKYGMLSTQASALIQGKRARVASTSIVNGQLTTIDDSLSARNLEISGFLPVGDRKGKIQMFMG
ncbi:hypothetical protein LXL04_028876 [Taraxacum kok-saghyz]